MMIHVSRFTDVQNRIAEAVNEWLVQVKSDVQNYAALDDEKREQIASLRYLHKVWMKHQLEKISRTNWDDICSNYLNRAIKVIMYFSAEEELKVISILNDLGLSGNEDIILIDARNDNKPSASNVKLEKASE